MLHLYMIALMMLLFVGFPTFDRLRDDPRFAELLTRMGLPTPPVRRSDTTSTPASTASTVTAASETQTITDAGDVRSILALPARLHGPDAEPYLADAIPMTLSTNLAEIEGLETKLPPSSHETKMLEDSPERLAAAYGVDALVLSSVMASPNELVINLQLAAGRTRRVLWSHQYSGTQAGYIDLLREATEGLRKSLRREPAPATKPRRRISSEAELALRRGQYYSARFNDVHDRKDYEIAREAFERALDLEPQFAECAGELAWLHVPLVEAGEPQAADQIEHWGRRAIEIDAQCGIGLVALAWWSVISGIKDDHSALDYALRAVASDPRDGRAHLQVACGLMTPSGSVQLMADAAVAASEKDPLYLYPMLCAALVLPALGRAEEALQINRRALDLDPDMPTPLMVDAYALCKLGRFDEAAHVIDKMAEQAKAGRLIEEWYLVPRYVLALHTGDSVARAETTSALLNVVREAGHGFTRHMASWHAAPLLSKKGDTEACFELLQLLSESKSLAYDHLSLNTDFDLYSAGPDGETRAPLTAKVSKDDVLRALDGGFFGVAEDF